MTTTYDQTDLLSWLPEERVRHLLLSGFKHTVDGLRGDIWTAVNEATSVEFTGREIVIHLRTPSVFKTLTLTRWGARIKPAWSEDSYSMLYVSRATYTGQAKGDVF